MICISIRDDEWMCTSGTGARPARCDEIKGIEFFAWPSMLAAT
jgi:hypothetical protein